MTLGLRTRLLSVTVAPLVALAALAVAGVPGWLVAAFSAAFAGLTALIVVGLLAPFQRLQSDAALALQEANLPRREADATDDGTAAVAYAVAELGRAFAVSRQAAAESERDFRETLTDAAANLQAVARTWQALPASRRPSPWAAENAALASAVGEAAAAGAAGQRRAAGLQAVLNDIATPVMVLDAKLTSIYLNAAAEDWFAHLPGRGMKHPLGSLLAEPVAADLAERNGTQPARPDEVVAWVKGGRGGVLEGSVDTADGTVSALFAAVPSRTRRANPWIVLTARDLSATKVIDANLRQLHRRLTGQRMSLLVAREAGPALDTIRTQAGLLAQAAKQAGQRERFVPKVQRILEEVGRQKIVIEQLGWLGRLSTTIVAEPDAEEVRLRAATDDVAAKLAPAFSERGNTIDLAGDAGWLMGDEEWIATVVAGLLLHANQSCERSAVAVTLSRRTSVSTADEVGEVAVQYAGPPITPAHLADIRDPFRRPNSGVSDSTGKLGFLLGLAVAHKVASLMGGGLIVDGSDGVVCLRVALPTRRRTDNRVAAGATSFVPGADAEDALGDFALGGAAAAVSTDTDTDTPLTAAHATAAPPDLASDDSIGSFFGPG